MKIKQKVLFIILVAFISVLVLVACSNGGEDTPIPNQQVTVTFNTNGGSNVTSQTFDIGGMATRPSNPTKANYTFVNWYFSDTFLEEFNFNTAITQNITIFARWMPNQTNNEPTTPNYIIPTGLSITFGNTLANVTLPSGWSWVAPTITPVGNAGVQRHYAIFTPSSQNYYSVTRLVTVTVAQATPTYTMPLPFANIEYGTILNTLTLPDNWAWVNGSQLVGAVGTRTFAAIYTPADTNFYPITRQIGVIVVSPQEPDPIVDAQAPIITKQPINATVTVGMSHIFNIEAVSPDGGTLNFQWFSNTVYSNTGGTPITGMVFESLVYVVASTEGRFYFYAVITNLNPTVNGRDYMQIASSVVVLTVVEKEEPTIINAQTPVITSQPANATVNAGEVHNLTVSANVTDGGTLSFQWFRNTTTSNIGGIPIVGATEATFIPNTNITGSFAVNYFYVVITNTNNTVNGQTTASITSEVVTLTIHGVAIINAQTPVITSQPANATVNAGEVYNLTVLANVTDSGTISFQWFRNTTASNIGGMPIVGAIEATFTPNTNITGSFAVNYFYVVITNTNNAVNGQTTASITSEVATLTIHGVVTVDAQIPTITQQSASAIVVQGQTHSLSAVASVTDGGTIWFQWFSNIVNYNKDGTALTAMEPYGIFYVDTSVLGVFFFYVVITNHNLSVNGQTWATAVSMVITITVVEYQELIIDAQTPVITNQPNNAAVTQNQAHTLSVAANVTDGGNLTFQWFSNTTASNVGGTLIAGATSLSFMPSTNIVGTFYFYVVITNTNNTVNGNITASVVSGIVTLTVNALPVINAQMPTITTQPNNATVTQGQAHTLSVAANITDGGNLTLQWFSNTTASNIGGTAIAGATGANFSPNTNTAGLFYFFVQITNTNNAVNGNTTATIRSQAVTLTVNQAPAANVPTNVRVEEDAILLWVLRWNAMSPLGQYDVEITNTQTNQTTVLRHAGTTFPMGLIAVVPDVVFSLRVRAVMALPSTYSNWSADTNYGIPMPDVLLDLTAVFGNVLADVALPAGWNWNAPNTSVGNAGTFGMFYATYNRGGGWIPLRNLPLLVTVGRAIPVYTLPTPTAIFGQTLTQISLPLGWAWVAFGGTAVGNAGYQTHNARFTPGDTVNFYTITRLVTVNVLPASLTAPTNLQTTNTTLIWNNVANNSGFIVEVNGVEHTVNTNSFSFRNILLDSFTIRVKALGVNNHVNSEWSDLINHTIQTIRYLDRSGNEQFIRYIDILTTTSGYRVLTTGWFALSGTASNSTIIINGSVSIILMDNVVWSINVTVPAGNILAIYAQSTGENAGRLNSDFIGGINGTNAANVGGIGGVGGNSGTIIISGGIITAINIGGGNGGNGSRGAAPANTSTTTHRNGGAGGRGGNSEAIIINSGTITATNIGGGNGGNGGMGGGGTQGTGSRNGGNGGGGGNSDLIVINGGTVIATSIGGGVGGRGGNGGDGIIRSSAGKNAGAGGVGGANTTITINGGNIFTISLGGGNGGSGGTGGIYTGGITMSGNAYNGGTGGNGGLSGTITITGGFLYAFSIGGGTGGIGGSGGNGANVNTGNTSGGRGGNGGNGGVMNAVITITDGEIVTTSIGGGNGGTGGRGGNGGNLPSSTSSFRGGDGGVGGSGGSGGSGGTIIIEGGEIEAVVIGGGFGGIGGTGGLGGNAAPMGPGGANQPGRGGFGGIGGDGGNGGLGGSSESITITNGKILAEIIGAGFGGNGGNGAMGGRNGRGNHSGNNRTGGGPVRGGNAGNGGSGGFGGVITILNGEIISANIGGGAGGNGGIGGDGSEGGQGAFSTATSDIIIASGGLGGDGGSGGNGGNGGNGGAITINEIAVAALNIGGGLAGLAGIGGSGGLGGMGSNNNRATRGSNGNNGVDGLDGTNFA